MIFIDDTPYVENHCQWPSRNMEKFAVLFMLGNLKVTCSRLTVQ
jgi:hypothetical protein